jgi:hypothetical protein
MKNLYDLQTAAEMKSRLARLQPDAKPLWGTMSPAQAIEHCSRGMEMATGDRRPPRTLIGRVIGPLIKRVALGNDAPMRPNSPTVPELVVADTRELSVERLRLNQLIDRFVAAGPASCTDYPHSFFGRLTPDQWSELMHKHLDHHLRQFGA